MTKQPVDLPGIRIVTVSGRIASGSTTLAKRMAEKLNWKHMEGGEIFWEAVRAKHGFDPKDTDKRADIEDKEFDASLKKILNNEKHVVLETKLAGFNAQGIEGVFKILIICNHHGEDQTQIRIDRLLNRESISKAQAKEEVFKREENDLEKWRRMYANGDKNWTYWNEDYYDLVINTYDHNAKETLEIALNAIGYKE